MSTAQTASYNFTTWPANPGHVVQAQAVQAVVAMAVPAHAAMPAVIPAAIPAIPVTREAGQGGESRDVDWVGAADATDGALTVSDSEYDPDEHSPDPVVRIQARLKVKFVKGFEPDAIKYNPTTGRPIRENRRAPKRLIMADSFKKSDKKHQQYREEEVVIDVKRFDEEFKRAIRESDEFGIEGGFVEEDFEDMEKEDEELEQVEEEIYKNDEVKEDELGSSDEDDDTEEDNSDDLESEVSDSDSEYLDSDEGGDSSEESSGGDASVASATPKAKKGGGVSAHGASGTASGHAARSTPKRPRKSIYVEDDDDADFVDDSGDELPEVMECYERYQEPESEDDPTEDEDEDPTPRPKKRRRGANGVAGKAPGGAKPGGGAKKRGKKASGGEASSNGHSATNVDGAVAPGGPAWNGMANGAANAIANGAADSNGVA